MQNEDEDMSALIDFSAGATQQDIVLRDMVERIEIADHTYLLQYRELETAYWKV